MSGAVEPDGPARAEAEARRLWARQSLPPTDGTLGHGRGPALRQLIGTYTPGDPVALVVQRAVGADVDARAAILGGDRVIGTLRREGWAPDSPDPVVAPLLQALGVWTGGQQGRPYDADDRSNGVQTIAARLAQDGVLVAREGPVRLCPSCASPRSPERVIYHEEVGDTFLVRFPLEPAGDSPAVDALAWVDAPWRLLGATALLLSPDLPYATVEYKRGDVTARLLTLSSSLPRLTSWLPGVELKVVGEQPGRTYVGRRYVYPLRHEFPDGATLPSPSGTVQAVAEVGDSGTGVVPLVPGHGGTDAQIAERLGIVGWPLLTEHGMLDLTLMHKYSGLDLETASEFVARDLAESGSVLARLRVLRGVPYCGVCGRPLVWFPGRYWCLEAGRLPAEQLARYQALLPDARPIAQIEVTPWPVSETTASRTTGAVSLLECERCSRLDEPESTSPCPCGGKRRRVSRRLVPSVAGAFAAWARNEPLAPGDSVRLYVGERRRVPAVVHQLAAMAGIRARAIDVRATILPTLSDVDLVGLVRDHGADAVRSALVRTEIGAAPGGSFVERCRQEARRLAQLTELTTTISAGLGRGEIGPVPVDPQDRELQPEDRAILARWAQCEVQVLAAYEEFRAAEAHRRLARFLEVDLARYRELVAARLVDSAGPSTRRSALRTLATLVDAIAVALAPIAPFTAESTAARLGASSGSLFESSPFDATRPAPNEALAEAWNGWLAVVRAVDRLRAVRHIPPTVKLPSVALLFTDDARADRFRGDRALLERICGIGRLEIGSPKNPWEGRRRDLVPVESEIQRAYPALATQIIHLVRRLPPRRVGDPEAAKGLSVFVQGQPHQITPSMITFVESLPERVVPTPFALGEMYAELPAGGSTDGGGLALSADAAWLVRRVGHRLKELGGAPGPARAVRVLAVDPLARELREHWAAIAAELGVATLAIDAPPPGDGVAAAVQGRTRLGVRWSVEISGAGPVRRARGRSLGAPHGRTRRLPLRQPSAAGVAPEVDFTNETVLHHQEELRTLGGELDRLLGRPLLGPSKVAIAWDAGLASVEAFEHAPFDQVAGLPGFGRPVAARLFAQLGREVPPPPPRVRPARPLRVEAPPSETTTLAPITETALALEPVPIVPELPEEMATEPLDLEPLPAPVPEIPAEPEGLPVPEPVAPIPPPAPPSRAPPAPPRPLEPAFIPEAERSLPAPVAPPPPPPTVGIEVELSAALLPALQPFLDATAAGHRGLAIVRELPERIRTLVGPRPVAVYWLSNLVRDRTIRPGDLAGLSGLLRQGIDVNGISAVFLEGVEYLARIHGSGAIAGFLKELDELARGHDARVWLHLTPGLLSPADLRQLAADLHIELPNDAPAESGDPPAPAG